MNSRSKVFSNLIWRFAERSGAQGVTFIVSIVLARLLDPSVYGTVALVTVYTTFLQVFVDGGFASALIQKKEADETDFSTVFYFNIVVCISLYLLMFFVSPIIAVFYNNDELTPVIRVVSLIILISGVKNVQQSYVSRHLIFKKFFFSTLGGTIGAAIVGIWMAYNGYGIWALVVQMLFNALVDTIILWFTVKWRPQKVFSFERLKALFSFGWKMLIANLVATTYKEIRQLVIGKMYSSEDLAYYNRGRQFPSLVVENTNTSIDSVLFPVLSKEQNNIDVVREMTRKSIKISTYIMTPLMIGLAACAEPLVRVLLTEKWMPCVPFLRIFCITFMFYPIQTANLNAIKATGRSGVLLKLQIMKNAIGLLFLFATMRYGPLAIAFGMLGSSICSQIINSWPNRKHLNYSYYNQLKDLFPALALSLAMGGIVYGIKYLFLPDLITLLLQVAVGGTFYVLISIVLEMESFHYCRDIIKSLLHKKEG